MNWKTIAWWAAGIIFAIAFVNVSVPHILKEEGPIGLLMMGIMIGAVAVYGYVDHQNKKERAERERQEEQRRSRS